MRRRRLSVLFAVGFLLVFGKQQGVKAGEVSPSSQRFLEEKEQSVFYGDNRARLEKSALSELDAYAEKIKENPELYISVIAYINNVENRKSDMEISRRRTSAVKDYLKSKGVPTDRIFVDWWGIEKTEFSLMADSEQRQLDRTTVRLIRRVEVSYQGSISAQHAVNPMDIVPLPEFDLPQVGIESTNIVTETKEEDRIAEETPAVEKDNSKEITEYEVDAEDFASALELSEEDSESNDSEVVYEEANALAETEKQGEVTAGEGMKVIRFVDADTGIPVEVDLDYKTPSGKASASSNEEGVIRIPLEELSTHKVDVYAYGYFFTSEKLKMVEGEQIIALTPIVEGGRISLTDLYFASESPELLPESMPALNRLSRALEMNPDARIEVGGHVNVPFLDPADLSEKQMALSTNRAKAVCDYLEIQGVDASRLEFKGYGNSKMVYPYASTDEERAMNRRVEIKIID